MIASIDESRQDKKRGKRRRWLLVLLLLLLLLLGSCCAVMFLPRASGDLVDAVSDRLALVIDPDATIQGAVEETEDDGDIEGIVIPGWGEFDFEANQTTQSVDLYNPEENAGKFYLTFSIEVQIDGAGEVIYSSGLIEPGLHVQTIQLERELPAGTYAAVVHVQPYRIDDDLTATNNADMQTTLVVS